MREALLAANRRYLEFISTLEGPSAGLDRLQKVAEPVRENDRTYRGFNFFSADNPHRTNSNLDIN